MPPRMPVKITATALMEGRPPIFCEMPMAMGVVTDLGESEMAISELPPSKRARPTAETIPVIEPTATLTRMGTRFRLIFSNCR